MATKKTVIIVLSCLLMVSLLGCIQANQKETPIITTPTISITETPISTPSSTPLPSPTPAPAYSHAPIISEENITKVEKLDNFDGSVSSVAISPNGKYLAATFENGTGIIWDISDVKYLREWRDAPKDIFYAKGSLSFNSDSNILATGGTLLELPSKRVIQELQGTVVFNSTNQEFALFDWNNISIWNLGENQPFFTLKQDSSGVANVVFSPNGALLGEALHWGSGEGVNIWRVSDYSLLYSFPPPEHSHPAHFNFFAYAFVAFSPDNNFVATGTRDQPVIRIWNLQTGELINDLNTVVETKEGEYYVPNIDCVSFTQDSTVIAIAGSDTIIFKRILDGEFITMLNIETYNSNSSKYITACAVSNDGKLFVTGDSGGDVSIWGVLAPTP